MVQHGTISKKSKIKEPPPDADFAIYIDFKKGERNPQRVFQAADAMLRGLQKVDETLCDSIDSNIKTLLVLEDIQAGSLKIWLKNALEATDDDALKTLDWKPQIGKYLVQGKYAYIKWANKPPKHKSIADLSKKIQAIAAKTDVKHLPDYKPPSIGDLIEPLAEIEKAKSYLMPGDKLSYLTPDGEKVDIDLKPTWTPEEMAKTITKEIVKFPAAPMILAVKKPDYLGHSQWELRHGKKPIHAKINDEPWLKRFQNREIDVRPGDALRCQVILEHSYGHDNELVGETYTVTKVEEVLVNQYKQFGFFDPESE